MPLITLSITGFYALSTLFVGTVFIRLLCRDRRPQDHFPIYALLASAFLLGQGILANVWLLLGLASLFKGAVIWGILIGTTIAGIFVALSLHGTIWDETEEMMRQIWKLSFLWKFLLVVVSLLIVLYSMKSIIQPPTGDAQAFYMVLPKIMADSERLKPLVNNYHEFTQIGLLGEMHFAALMSIGDPHAAKFYVWFTSLALATLLLSLCGRIGLSLRGQIIALIILFTSSTFTYYITNGKVDIFGGAFGVAAYYWAFCTGRDKNILALILTGLFAGFSFIAKFSNIPVILIGILVVVIWNRWLRMPLEHDRPKDVLVKTITALILVGFSIFLSMIPHFIKNGALFGEPFAPFLFLRGAGTQWADQTWYSPENTKFILSTYPIAVIFGKYPMQDGNLSALVLAFTPLLILLKKPASLMQSGLFLITMVAIIGLITWTIVRPSILAPRYIMATLLLFIPLAARSAENVMKGTWGQKYLKKVVAFSLVFSLFLFLGQNFLIPKRFIKFLSGNLNECEGANTYCNSMTFISNYASLGDRIYIGGYYTYDLRPDLLQCMLGPDQGWSSLKTPWERWEYLFSHGFNYLVIQRSSHKSMLQSFDPDMAPSWLQVRQIYDDQETAIYSLDSHDSKHSPRLVCRQVHSPGWDVVER
jgi:hypothetical protein